jgi:antitoxin MazE
MKTNIIQIGNSRGIRLPKSLLQECGLDDNANSEVEVTVKNKHLIITKAETARCGWDNAFKKMALAKDDQLIDIKDASSWDKEEWEWK